ncbi:MAG: nitroreductase family deazaflavin-dependent oxidoreductase [bacterium]|nr:nitroreductase family deazaflavin-dependent oxidoreductase [bacterium]
MAKGLKWAGGIVGLYVVFVVLFETVYLGHFQPSFEGGGIPMLDIVTTDEAGALHKRRLAWLQSSSGPMYVSAHHWTRGWYHKLVANPNVRIEIEGRTASYVAVVVTGDEFDRIAAEFPLPFLVRFLMGFPLERDLVRLDPVPS